MRILNYIPRHALIVFFWCALFAAIACFGSIIAFVVLMPDNRHGRQGVVTAYRAFGPGLVVAIGIAVASYCVLRSTRRAGDISSQSV